MTDKQTELPAGMPPARSTASGRSKPVLGLLALVVTTILSFMANVAAIVVVAIAVFYLRVSRLYPAYS